MEIEEKQEVGMVVVKGLNSEASLIPAPLFACRVILDKLLNLSVTRFFNL